MSQEMTPEQQKELQEKLKKMSPEELRQFQKQQCVFCQIVAGKIPAKRIYEDEFSIVILDINPAVRGHMLVIPKEHYAIMPQIPDKEIGHLYLVGKYLSQILLKAMKVTGTNVYVANGLAAGQKSQHFMLHVIPRKEGDGIMAVDEKLLDPNIQSKVVEMISRRLYDLLGVKKEIVNVEEKKPASEESKEHEKPHQEQKPELPPPPPPEPAPPHQEPEEDEGKDDNVSLDDIANLFK